MQWLLPFKKISKIAIKEFEKQFLIALEKYEAKQDYMKKD